jgi:integrase
LISGSVVALKDRTAPDGVERLRSTKCIHEAAAREILHGLEAAELLGARAGAVAQQFRALIREAVARVTGRALPDPTIRAHLAAWVAGEEGAVAPGHARALPASRARFWSVPRPRAAGRLEALGKEHFLAYRTHLQKAGHRTANINQVFKILARPCRITADERLVQQNPVGVIKRLRGTASEKETFTPAQVAALLAAAPDAAWRALIALGFYTGPRLKDCSRLTWGAFDGPA